MATILVAENEPDISEALIMLLRRAGHQVHHTSDGNDTLTQARGTPIDLLIINPALPGINGLDICHQLRNETATARLPILLVSVHQYPAEQRAARDAGADDYLGKPFDNHELLTRVETLLTKTGHRTPT